MADEVPADCPTSIPSVPDFSRDLITQDVPLKLAHNRYREGRYGADVTGNLVMGDLAAAEVAELAGAGLRPIPHVPQPGRALLP